MKTRQSRAETTQWQPAPERSSKWPVWVPPGASAAPHGALQAGVDQSPRMLAQRQVIDAAFGTAIQRQADALEDDETLQARMTPVAQRAVHETEPASVRSGPVESRPNLTGMPNQLKAGIESLSGMDLSHVRVHRNSDKPAQLHALAYAQGHDIHLGPGQEQYLPHEAWHVVQQAQGRVAPTRQMKTGVAINDDAGLEHEADVMGARALQMQAAAGQAAPQGPAGQQAQADAAAVAGAPGVVQRIALYHGTTIENANLVKDGVDPSKGKGEFGQGFYTVFAQDQARHIAMYYWDKEKKYDDVATGIAVVKMSIPDNWWASLMKTSDDRYKVTHSENDRDWSMLKHQADPREGNDADEDLDVGDTEHDATEGKPWFLPRNAEEDVDYQDEEERDTNLGHDIIVGPIKDKQTPYLQVVFGPESADYLLDAEEVTRSITVSQPQGKAPFGTGAYNPIKAQALEQTGSLVETATGKIKRFREGLAGATNQSKRLQLLQNVFGGMEDKHIPDEMVGVFTELNVQGADKGEQAFNYYKNGPG